MTTNFAVEGKETLKLTEWEAANLHLPPVTTVTLYKVLSPLSSCAVVLLACWRKIAGSPPVS